MSQQTPSFGLRRIAQLALFVIVRPSEYFRTMPRSGPLSEPLYFTLVLGGLTIVVSALIGGVFGHAISPVEMVLALGLVIGAAFVGGAILFLLWKILGSKQGYQAALRCTIATLAISPITAVLSFLPYFGLLVNVVWTMVLLVIASVEVHDIGRRKALVAFSILGVFLALGSWYAGQAQDVLVQELESRGITAEDFRNMSSEEQRQLTDDILSERRSQRANPTPDSPQ